MYNVHLSREEFENLISGAIALLPQKIRKDITNIEFVLEDQDDPNSNLFGLYQGIPLTKRGNNYAFVIPDKITIYKSTIEKYAQNYEDLKRIVTRVVWHEIGHYFGYSEKEIRKLEKKWSL